MIEEDLFIQKTGLERLTLFRTIVGLQAREQLAESRLEPGEHQEMPEINLRRVASILNRNYGTLYYTYASLLEILQEITGGEKTDSRDLMRVSEGQLRFHLVSSSIPYQFLKHLLYEDISNFEEFMQVSNVSRVTLLRYLRPMRDLAKQLDVRIVYERMAIQGNELQVRIFFTMAFWLATNGSAWPFETIKREEVTAASRRIGERVDISYTRPVVREVLRYYLAITSLRIQRGHVVESMNLTDLSYPTPNLFDDATTIAAPQSRESQFLESEVLLLMNYALPMYYATGDPINKRAIAFFKRYNTKIYYFVDLFIAALPSSVIDMERLPAETQQMFQANFLSLTLSVLLFGHDVGQLIAYSFNPQASVIENDEEYRATIHSTIEYALTQSGLGQTDMLLREMSDVVYRNLILVRQFYQSSTEVKVALMLEPTILGFIDLVAFLNQQPFVEILSDNYENADLVIQSSDLPLEFPVKYRFHWSVDGNPDRFGALYAMLSAIRKRKLEKKA